MASARPSISPVGKLVARVYGIAHPQEIGITKIAKILAAAGMQHDDGSRISNDEVKAANRELEQLGIVSRLSPARGLVATSNSAVSSTLEARKSKQLLPILNALEAEEVGGIWQRDTFELRAMRARCYLLGDELKRLAELDGIENEAWRFLADPAAIGFLRKVPARYKDAAAQACLDHAIESAAEPDAIISAILKYVNKPERFIPEIALVPVLQGNFEEAIAMVEGIEQQADPQLRAAAPSIRALTNTLRGDQAAAHEEIANALRAVGDDSDTAIPQNRAFALALISLVKLHTPETNLLLNELIGRADKVGCHPLLYAFVRGGQLLREGEDTTLLTNRYGPSLYAMLAGLLQCWRDDLTLYEQNSHREALIGLVNQSLKNQYRWIAAEALTVLAEAGSLIPHPPNVTPDKLAAAAERRHEELGTVSLLQLIEPLPDWELPLQALEEVALEAKQQPKTTRRQEAGSARIVWEVTIEDDQLAEIKPREQRADRSGGWTRGRIVSLKRMVTESAEMAYLMPQDRTVIAAITHANRGWGNTGSEYTLGLPGLFALAGHPLVVNGSDQPLTVVHGEVQLIIQDEADGRLRADVVPFANDWDDFHLAMASPTRCTITRFTDRQRQLCKIIPAAGLTFPETARERLMTAVTALLSEVRVLGDVPDDASSAERVTADHTPKVQLTPAAAGLKATVVVEPISDTGLYAIPGDGSAVMFAERGGVPLQTRRDLAAELEAREPLLAAFPELRCEDPDFPAYFDNPAESLDLLERLRTADVPCLWPEGEAFKVVGRADTSQLRVSIRSAAQWFAASAELPVDEGRVLGLQRLMSLLDDPEAGRFLALGDGQFLALTETLHQQLQDLRGAVSGFDKGEAKLHPLAGLSLADFLAEAEVDSDAAWQQQQQRWHEAQAFDPELPSTLIADLRPYQHEGFTWLARLSQWGAGACLADDMGLGKTVQTLALLLHRAADGPSLVVAPTSVAPNWIAEAERFAPSLNITHYAGNAKARADLLDNLGASDVVVTTYGLMQNDAERLSEIHWNCAILDEAQAIKNSATKRARAAYKLNADFRLATTGTPIQNNLMDLHSLFHFVNPGLLGSKQHFRDHFALPIERGSDSGLQSNLQQLVAPFILRRLKSEVLTDLPPRTEIVLHVEMSTEEAALYEALRRRALEELQQPAPGGSEGQRHLAVLAHLTRLRQACCNPRLVQSIDAPASSKLATFGETLTELLTGNHKVLVFSQFVQHLKLIEEYLQANSVSYQYLDGQTTQKERSRRIDAFQAGDGDVFLISLKAGGTGLNLTAADYVIHMDPWWNPAVEDQASDRAHRIGQTRPVTIYRLVTKGTIEEQIVALHQHKRELADQLLAGADSTGRLDADELLSLLRGS